MEEEQEEEEGARPPGSHEVHFTRLESGTDSQASARFAAIM